MTAPEFFTPEWAADVRAALQAGPDDAARAGVLPEYWAFFDQTHAEYAASWALGVRDLPGSGAPSYLVVRWGGGTVADCRVVGPDEPLEATYVLSGGYAAWRDLLSGYDAKKTVMYRRILLDEGDLLEFFTTIYFFVECLAQIGRVPTSFPAESVPAELAATG
jgi:hypothetical protein